MTATAHADQFLREACVPRVGAHVSGTLDRANALLEADPDVAGANIHTAAVLGNEAAVRGFLALAPSSATDPGGPYGWDPLTTLCFSRYLRLDRSRDAAFVATAAALLDAGADSNTGWWESPGGEWESVIYGAAGLAQHAGVTRLLLERGADPNDEETPYHVPESYEHAAMIALLDSGRLTADSLATMLIRKADWHDAAGMRLLLERGADPNRMSRWKVTALQQAVRRDNALATIALLLDHGADAALSAPGGEPCAAAIAARRGRADILDLLEQRGIAVAFDAETAALADLSRNKNVAHGAGTLDLAHPGEVLAQFAGTGNVDGVRRLLDAGVPVDAPDERGDGYFDIAPRSTALHVAAWRARHAVVALLLERGADPRALDGRGRSAIALAARACVDSYWTALRAPDSVAALLAAGADPADVSLPTGYAPVDRLLERA